MTLRKTTSILGRLGKRVHRSLVMRIGLLAAVGAIGCAGSRAAQSGMGSAEKTDSASPTRVQAEAPAAPAAAQAPAATQLDASGQDSGDTIPEGAIIGKIVSASRNDSGAMTLYLNQGSKAGLRPNMNGHILEGSEGGKRLDGGTFTIVQVTGDDQAVATIKLTRSLGQHNRFLIQKPK